MKRSNALYLAVALFLMVGAAATTVALAQDYPSSPPPATATATLTATGVVVSSSSDSLVLKMDDGTQMTFHVDTSSRLPAAIAKGDRIRVDYNSPSQGGTYHATVVTMETSATPPGSTATTRTYESSTATDTPSGEAQYDAETAQQMPRTASPLPLIALAGLVALGLGLGLRRYVRAHA